MIIFKLKKNSLNVNFKLHFQKFPEVNPRMTKKGLTKEKLSKSIFGDIMDFYKNTLKTAKKGKYSAFKRGYIYFF